MLSKKIAIEVDAATFPKGVPQELRCTSPTKMCMGSALLLLGTVTVPAGMSVASPARYWAWARYFSALHTSKDLRITAPFSDLDPHLKTNLSDDLGVGVTVKWLVNCLGGVAEIVDGRKFISLYGSLISRPPKKNLPKVGKGKCPDYVIRDQRGRWHVLECKGTQTSEYYRDQNQLATAVLQKQVIGIGGARRGYQLAAGIFLGSESGSGHSSLRVVDPESEAPLVEITNSHYDEAEIATKRLTIARSLAIAGFDEMADATSLVERRDAVFDTYSAGEYLRASIPLEQRWEAARDRAAGESRRLIRIGKLDVVGDEVEIPISGRAFRESTGANGVRIRQGINRDFLEQIIGIRDDLRPKIDRLGERFLKSDSLISRSNNEMSILEQGDLFASSVELI